MKFPLIIVNFKTYPKASGRFAEKLAATLEKAAGKRGGHVVLAVQNADVFRVSKKTKLSVFAQHIDPVGQGAYTGKDSGIALKDAGAKGVLINHFEDRTENIKESIEFAKKSGLKSLVCVEDDILAGIVAKMKPDMIAIEPPELISSGISVSRAKPGLITSTINRVHKINKKLPIICGAGVTTKEDVRAAMDLGCSGVLPASAISNSNKPRQVLKKMLGGL